MKNALLIRVLVLALCVAPFLGAIVGYRLHSSPAPSPTVRAAEAGAHTAVAVADASAHVAAAVRDTARKAIANYAIARKRDTVVVDSIVYVAAAPADSLAKRCADVLPADSTAIAKKDTAIAKTQTVVVAVEAQRPSRLRTIAKDLGFLAVGYVAGRAGIGAHVGISIPFR